MRASFVVPTALLLATLTHCDRPAPSAAAPTSSLISASAASASANVPAAKNFVAHLAGANEVPARDTRAQGEIKLQLSADGKALEYRIISSNISNVFASHIHIAPAGVNGSIVVFLFGSVPPGGGRTDGVLANIDADPKDSSRVLDGEPLAQLTDDLVPADDEVFSGYRDLYGLGDAKGRLVGNGCWP